ncbi:MAG: hypothetical protein KatS3mg022_0605 [Armatimonadota bacterium]|nr:MAG: hypothetical protein KatS3mg022_0605 [Armatimonadota bacterium]
MGTRVRAVLYVIAMLAVVCTFVFPSFAGINDTWDWKGQKRKLKVHVNAADANKEFGGKKLKDIVKEAMDNWNSVKADTGWEFEEGTASDHDIEIKTGKSGGGGAHTTFDNIDKNREVTKRSVVIDPDFKKGWGFNDDDKKNPVSTMKHELSHTLRLTHQGGTRSKTGKIKDPQGGDTKDDDVTTISQDDKNEANKSSTAPIRKAQAPVGPNKDAHLEVLGFPDELPFAPLALNAEIDIPNNMFTADNELVFSATEFHSMPNPLNVPVGLERMVKGVHISTEQIPQVNIDSFFDVFVPYEDGMEGEGWLIDIRDPKWTPIIETTLRPFFYEPSMGEWLALDVPFSLDTTNDFLRMQVPAQFVAQYAGPGSGQQGLFLSISGTPVPDASTLVLFSTGLLGLAGAMRRRTLARRK